jgi:pSer/pThr/pTyr-binding forkhead associated (FHA) protein
LPFPPLTSFVSTGDEELTAFVEDTSTNGTFLNGEKLKKGVPTILRTSDLISLIDPTPGRNLNLSGEEIELTSLTLHLSPKIRQRAP